MQVELRPAYVFDCPECGREVFLRGLVPELSDDDLLGLRLEQGIEPWENGSFVMMPAEVECSYCGESFETLHFEDA